MIFIQIVQATQLADTGRLFLAAVAVVNLSAAAGNNQIQEKCNKFDGIWHVGLTTIWIGPFGGQFVVLDRTDLQARVLFMIIKSVCIIVHETF